MKLPRKKEARTGFERDSTRRGRRQVGAAIGPRGAICEPRDVLARCLRGISRPFRPSAVLRPVSGVGTRVGSRSLPHRNTV